MRSTRRADSTEPTTQRADALSGLTIVLPCLDEAENLAQALRTTAAAATRCAHEYEIVVVDDGSIDETWEIAGDFAEADSRVHLVIHPGHLGYGQALRSGIAVAHMPWVLMIDADLQYDIDELTDFLPHAAAADLVLGQRIAPQDTRPRRAADAVWARLLHGLLRLPTRDLGCSFRLARLDSLVRLDLRAGDALFGAELLVQSHAAGLRIAQVPVHHRVRVAGRQAGPGRRLTARTARELIALRRTTRSAR